jgi:TRAP-type C4-dicarboxylate transport system permease small subunit
MFCGDVAPLSGVKEVLLLEKLAKVFAIFAGLVMVGITVLTCYSVIGRQFGKPVLGDFELVQMAMGFAVAAFLPYCQHKRGNIIVDFFTTKAKASTRDWMDRFGCLTVAVMMGLFAWRTFVGGLNEKNTGSVSMLMQLPTYPAYYAMVPAFALTALIALVQFLKPSAPSIDTAKSVTGKA